MRSRQHSTAQHSTAQQGRAGQGRAGQGRAGHSTAQQRQGVAAGRYEQSDRYPASTLQKNTPKDTAPSASPSLFLRPSIRSEALRWGGARRNPALHPPHCRARPSGGCREAGSARARRRRHLRSTHEDCGSAAESNVAGDTGRAGGQAGRLATKRSLLDKAECPDRPFRVGIQHLELEILHRPGTGGE